METVVVVLMILVSFNFLLKLTYCKLWTVGVIAVSACLFVGLMWPLAIEQSKTQIADWLSNPQLMLDTSVILSLEVVLQLAYCMLAAHLQTAGKVGSRTVLAYRCLRLFPGSLDFCSPFQLAGSFDIQFPGYFLQFTGLGVGSSNINPYSGGHVAAEMAFAREGSPIGVAVSVQCVSSHFGSGGHGEWYDGSECIG